PQHFHAAASGMRYRAEQAQQGAFSRPVGAQQGPVLALLDSQRHVVQQVCALPYEIDVGSAKYGLGVRRNGIDHFCTPGAVGNGHSTVSVVMACTTVRSVSAYCCWDVLASRELCGLLYRSPVRLPAMYVASLANRTDLALLRMAGSEIAERGDHLVV